VVEVNQIQDKEEITEPYEEQIEELELADKKENKGEDLSVPKDLE
jgi:hypothetical protein